MASDELHLKYAPIMRFSRGERFSPMSVNDFLSYSSLYVKGQSAPALKPGQVTPDELAGRYNSPDTFLRSVTAGPLQGMQVVGDWGLAAVRLIYEWAQNPIVAWNEEIARSAYNWLTEKTRPAARLFWWNNLLPHVFASKGLTQELPRFKLPQDARNSAIANYQASQGANRNYTYYYRTVQQGSYLDLQYWFFYGYNDWAGGYDGFNDHEGDWEGLHVFFKLYGQRPVEPPAHLCYVGHHSRMTKAWDHPEVQKTGTHPIVYVGAGSHACYPQPKQYPLMALYNLIDYATGESFTLDHSEWKSRISLETLPWLLTYRGSWGTRYWLPLEWASKALGLLAVAIAKEVELPGVSAPRGPKFSDEGGERETWNAPLTFAGII